MKRALRIAVVAPAGIFSPERLAVSEALVRSWGHELVHAPHLFARHRYTAGTTAQRLEDLDWALTEPGFDVVWFARGGFGTGHLLPHLPWEEIDDRVVLGFSDATVLLWALARRGVGTPVHGPVLQSLADLADADSQQHVRALLAGMAGPVLRGRWLIEGEPVQGELVGGNLAMLASLCGTPEAFSARDRILLIEDVGEAPYRLDRMLTQLVQSGALEGVKAVALGDFRGTRFPEDGSWGHDELWTELLAPLGVPVIADVPVGHGPRNWPWRVGGEVWLSPGTGAGPELGPVRWPPEAAHVG